MSTGAPHLNFSGNIVSNRLIRVFDATPAQELAGQPTVPILLPTIPEGDQKGQQDQF
jgi:hypothetical protein